MNAKNFILERGRLDLFPTFNALAILLLGRAGSSHNELEVKIMY